jgi:hypothetical protein
MAFEPDILVTSADGFEVMLVAEAKLFERDLSKAESQLKAYMAGMGAPVGLLVTPRRLRIYRDRYLASLEKSIEQVGEFDVSHIFGPHFKGADRHAALKFENAVQSWLESLAMKAGLDKLPFNLRSAAELNIVPAVSQGIVRAGHPRSILSA